MESDRESTELVTVESAPLPTIETRAGGGTVVPAIVAAAGDHAMRRFLDFFAVTIDNPNTRAAYFHACRRFFAWCDRREDMEELVDIEPMHCRDLYPRAREGLREADRQAASRRDPHAVRPARHWPGGRDQSRPCGARPEERRQNRQDHGA
jgi:hypothetical protein